MKKKKTLLVMLFLIMVLVSSSIVLAESGNESEESLRFTFVTPLFGHPYWKTVQDGMDAAAEDLGVNCKWVGPSNINISEQISYIEQAIAVEVDAIITMALNPEAFTPVINKAEEAGIPVVLVDTDAPNSKRSAYIGTNNKQAGIEAGKAMIKATKGKGKVAIITGAIDANNLNLRIEGFKEAIKESNLEVVAVEASNTDLLQANEKAQSLLRAYPDLDAFLGVSATDVIGAAQAVQEAGKVKEIDLVGFDDMDQTVKLIKEGTIDATIAQRPQKMGYMGVEFAKKLVMGEKVPEVNDTGVIVITQENVESYSK